MISKGLRAAVKAALLGDSLRRRFNLLNAAPFARLHLVEAAERFDVLSLEEFKSFVEEPGEVAGFVGGEMALNESGFAFVGAVRIAEISFPHRTQR